MSSRVFRSSRIAAALILIFAATSFGAELATVTTLDDASNPAKNLARMNCGATIDLVGSNGRLVTVTNKEAGPGALLLDDDTLNYSLPEGDTTLLLSFPRTSALDRFTFVNENASAAGELKIAVSNYRLPAKSSKWIEVN